MNVYTNPVKLETLIYQAQVFVLLEPQRQARARNLRRAFLTLLDPKDSTFELGSLKAAPTGLGRFKAAKYALRTAWAALTTTLEPQGAS